MALCLQAFADLIEDPGSDVSSHTGRLIILVPGDPMTFSGFCRHFTLMMLLNIFRHTYIHIK